MDVVVQLEVGHPRCHLRSHVDELGQLEVPPFTLEVVEETPFAHQLGDDVDWLPLRAHRVQLDEFRVAELLHDLGLC